MLIYDMKINVEKKYKLAAQKKKTKSSWVGWEEFAETIDEEVKALFLSPGQGDHPPTFTAFCVWPWHHYCHPGA